MKNYTSLHSSIHIQLIPRKYHIGPWNLEFVHSNILRKSVEITTQSHNTGKI